MCIIFKTLTVAGAKVADESWLALEIYSTSQLKLLGGIH